MDYKHLTGPVPIYNLFQQNLTVFFQVDEFTLQCFLHYNVKVILKLGVRPRSLLNSGSVEWVKSHFLIRPLINNFPSY